MVRKWKCSNRQLGNVGVIMNCRRTSGVIGFNWIRMTTNGGLKYRRSWRQRHRNVQEIARREQLAFLSNDAPESNQCMRAEFRTFEHKELRMKSAEGTKF